MEFLFDDEWIEVKRSVRRVMGAVRKDPEPVFRGENPWEVEVDGRHAFIYDREEKKYKFWYTAHSVDKATMKEAAKNDDRVASERVSAEHRSFLCYAESPDGVRWERPEFGFVEFQGSRKNNILLETTGRDDTVYFNIVKDPDDPDPERRYKAFGFEDCKRTALKDGTVGRDGVVISYSADGIHWKEDSLQIFDTRHNTDCNLVLPERDPTTGKWVAFLRPRTSPKRRFIGYSESEDWDHWTWPRMLLTPDRNDHPSLEFYGFTVDVIDGWRVGALWIYHNIAHMSTMTDELAYSRNGVDYRRAMPNQDWVPLGGPGSFDSRWITVVKIDPQPDEVRIFYRGSNFEHGSDRGRKEMTPMTVEEGQERTSALGIARIKGRNFCGLRADHDGIVETKWIANPGQGGVEAWAEIEAGGFIRCEILNCFDEVIPGFSMEESAFDVAEDGRILFHWGREKLRGENRNQSPEGGMVRRVVRLRFHLFRATLFGFQIGEPGSFPEYKEGY